MRFARGPRMQLARAGERTEVLAGSGEADSLRFNATVLEGAVEGRIEIEDADGPRTAPLHPENLVEGTGLTKIAVCPTRDTAITLVRESGPAPAALIGGGLLLAGAIGWTLLDTFG